MLRILMKRIVFNDCRVSGKSADSSVLIRVLNKIPSAPLVKNGAVIKYMNGIAPQVLISQFL